MTTHERTRRRAAGFTLIELLVAIFITAVMFAMGYEALTQGGKSRDSLKDQQRRLLELQSAVRVLEQDFAQVAPRPVRQAVGDEPGQPALLGAPPGTQPVVALTRGGWANPGGLQRPGLQRVAYILENGTLRRDHWNVLDPTLASVTVRRDLLTHVKTFAVRYLDQYHLWQEQWPPTLLRSQQVLRQRPVAVEITIDTEEWGKIVRIIEIPG